LLLEKDVRDGIPMKTPSTERQDPEAPGERRFSGWRGSLNRLIWRAHIFIAGSLVVWVERLFPNRGYGQRIFSASARLTNRLLGIRVEVLGLDKLDRDQAYVFTPNHRSHVDITALLAALPAVRFAAKRELFDEPVLGTAMRAMGMIPIDRNDPALAKRTLDEAAAKLGRTVSVVIFPEGTRAPAGQMLPLKGGAFVFAIEEQVSVVPVALHNAAQVMPAHGYLTILGGRVVVEILDPIPTAGLAFEDRHRLQEQAHEALVRALRPEDGGVADRRDLGSFAGHAFGVHVADVTAPSTACAPASCRASSSHALEEKTHP
jgi:1-acyl-sn-glycerol-3-phosphate acyltransferase